jgi:hypothetical protein
MSDDGWLRGRKEIAAYLGVNPNYIRQYFRRNSGFPAMFDGRLMVAKKDAIDAWILKRSKRACPYDCTPCVK